MNEIKITILQPSNNIEVIYNTINSGKIVLAVLKNKNYSYTQCANGYIVSGYNYQFKKSISAGNVIDDIEKELKNYKVSYNKVPNNKYPLKINW
jgi:hypothetical protein